MTFDEFEKQYNDLIELGLVEGHLESTDDGYSLMRPEYRERAEAREAERLALITEWTARRHRERIEMWAAAPTRPPIFPPLSH